MKNAKIVTLYEYTITKNEWETLPTDYQAALATLCFAINEISIFSFLYGASVDRPKDEIVLKKSLILSNTMLRTLSAKVFEAISGFRNLKKTIEKRAHDDGILIKILENMDDKLSSLTSDEAFETAKLVRDKACNHYLPQEVEKRLKYISQGADRSLVLEEKLGDSFFPIGEEGVFFAIFNYQAAKRGTTPEIIMKEWQDWSVSASALSIDLFNDVALAMIKQFFPEKSATQRKPYVEPKFLHGYLHQPLALFNFQDPVADEF